jgi:hypothetical protein
MTTKNPTPAAVMKTCLGKVIGILNLKVSLVKNWCERILARYLTPDIMNDSTKYYRNNILLKAVDDFLDR